MRNSIKRLLNIALAILLVVSFLPVQVFAAEGGEAFARNEDTGAVYSEVAEALAEASAGETVVLAADAEERLVQVPADVTLDLNGKTLTASYATSFGDIIDSSADNTGLLAVDSERAMFTAENRELPVNCGDGYRFVKVTQFNEAVDEEANKYYFQPLFEEAAVEILKKHSEENGVSIRIYVAWQKGDEVRYQEFVFGNDMFKEYIASYNSETGKYGKMFTITLKNYPVSDLFFVSAVVSETGVKFMSIDSRNDEEETNGIGTEVATDEDNKISEEVSFSGNGVLAEIEAGAQLEEGATSVTLTVAPMETTGSNIVLGENETMTSYDIHIEGLSPDNTVPVKVTLFRFLEKGLNSTSVALYHVENGVTVPMTLVAEPKNHNEFSYDPATGTVVICAATFSEYTAVTNDENLWEGGLDYTWYNPNWTSYTIYSAEQLAAFGRIVDGTAEGFKADDFKGKTVLLGNDINLKGGQFNPIGCGYVDKSINSGNVDGRPFCGTFDGQGHTISNFTQDGWEIGLSYCNLGGGLFASIANGTVKNLVITGAKVTMECVEMGALVGLSQGNCTYENIEIYDSNIANYQRATGGLIGEISPLIENGITYDSTSISNVIIGSDVVVGTLWGDFDAPVGGVIGALWNNNNVAVKVNMKDVIVASRLDVYNDVTSSYQWYAYRRAGMLIGNTETSEANENGTEVATAPLTCTNVTVKYGNWVKYHYCEFPEEYNSPSWPWVRVEAGENCSAYSNPRWGVAKDAKDGNPITDAHTKAQHVAGGDHYVELEFNQLYGGGQGVYGQPAHDGVTIQRYYYTVTYMDRGDVFAIDYVNDDDLEDGVYKIKHNEYQPTRTETTFKEWVNAGGKRAPDIEKGNVKDYIVYDSWKSVFTARFVDWDGNVIKEIEFTEGTTKLNEEDIPDVPTMEGGYTGVWEDYTLGKNDITIHAIYNEKEGVVKLTPVDENPKDGVVERYKVTGVEVDKNNVYVEIPSSFNGKPVDEISDGAFAKFDDIEVVVIPTSITKIGSGAFADYEWNLHKETINFVYEGTYKQWQNIEIDDNWDSNVATTSKIFFPADGTYSEKTRKIVSTYWADPVKGTFNPNDPDTPIIP